MKTIKRGRPRLHESATERVRAFRGKKKAEGQRRLDILISEKNGRWLDALCRAWGNSPGQVVGRLLTESEKRHRSDMRDIHPGPTM